MKPLRTIPIRRTGIRPTLFFGVDRELFMFATLLCAILCTLMDTKAAIGGICGWIAALYVLRLMAKSDPMMRQIYVRHILRYKSYYPPRSTPFRINTNTQKKRYS